MRYAALAFTAPVAVLLSLATSAAGQTAAASAGVPSLPASDLNPTAQELTWKSAAPSPFARVEAPSLAVGGKLYLFGGFTAELKSSPEVDVYDPAARGWPRRQSLGSE